MQHRSTEYLRQDRLHQSLRQHQALSGTVQLIEELFVQSDGALV